MAAPQVLLSDYLQVVRDLLHDPNDAFSSQAAKIRWINRGLQMRDIITKYNRVLKSFAAVAGTDSYTFTDAGDTRVFDVIGVNVIYGNLRIVLDQISFTEMNARLRQYSPAFRSCPVGWTRYGANTVYVAPAPSSTYTLEFDCARYSTPLAAVGDADDLPYPYTEPVPYWAAGLAKLNERQNDEAQDFFDSFYLLCAIATGERTGQLASAYGGKRGY